MQCHSACSVIVYAVLQCMLCDLWRAAELLECMAAELHGMDAINQKRDMHTVVWYMIKSYGCFVTTVVCSHNTFQLSLSPLLQLSSACIELWVPVPHPIWHL